MMAVYRSQSPVMTLKQLLLGLCETDYLPDIEIQGLALDSRKVDTGYAFIALQGQLDHGLAYAEVALNGGAVVVLCDAEFDQYCQQILSRIMTRAICVPIKNLSAKLGELASRMYGPAHNDLFIAAVTGTDGKTSVSHFIAQAMHQAHGSAALIGTLGNGILGNAILGNGVLGGLDESTHTTPDIISLHEMLADYKRQGARHVSMEVSSHGLDQQRVAGIDFNVAILTNLSRDHLDYHGTIEAYKAAKKRLFSEHAQATVILNADDAFGCELYEGFTDPANINAAHTTAHTRAHTTAGNIWLYGLEKRALTKSALSSARLYAIAEGVKTRPDGLMFMLNSSHGMAQVRVQLMGEFNIYNVLACFCTLIQSGINFNHAIKYISNLHTVPGRMELLHESGKPSVVIDYAHTPQALSQALENARKHVSGKLICVFGCGGDRDRGKRPLMAQGAEQLADVLIVTSDNPRNEDPQAIINDIKAGISDETHLLIETDRRKAILQAITMADEKDLILIAGKGHENYQLIGHEKISFNDRLVAQHGLLSYGAQHSPRHYPGRQ